MNWAQTFQLASSVLGAYAHDLSGRLEAQQYLGQAEAFEYNAEVTRYMGRKILEATSLNQQALARQQRQFQGRQRAALAQAGIGTGGSAADVVAQDAARMEQDQINLAMEGAARFQAALTQADFEDLNATLSRSSARGSRRAGRLGAARSLIGGAATIFGKGT